MTETPYHGHRCSVCGRKRKPTGYSVCLSCAEWAAMIYDPFRDSQLRYLELKNHVYRTLRAANWLGPSRPWPVRWASPATKLVIY